MAAMDLDDAACEALELIRSASEDELTADDEYLLAKQVWSILGRANENPSSRLQVCNVAVPSQRRYCALRWIADERMRVV